MFREEFLSYTVWFAKQIFLFCASTLTSFHKPIAEGEKTTLGETQLPEGKNRNVVLATIS